MSYTPGILNRRVTLQERTGDSAGAFGHGSTAAHFRDTATVWAAVDWTRGAKSLREGALDAYDTVMVRMRWTPAASRTCRLRIDGKTYAIDSFHADRQANTIQITATELVNPEG